MDLDGFTYTAKYKTEGSDTEKNAEVTDKTFTVPESAVVSAEDADKPLVVTVTATAKQVKLTGDEKNMGAFRLYEPGVGPTDQWIRPDAYQEVPYGQAAYVYADLEDFAGICKVTSVLAGSTALRKTTETIGGQPYTFYTVPATALKDG